MTENPDQIGRCEAIIQAMPWDGEGLQMPKGCSCLTIYINYSV